MYIARATSTWDNLAYQSYISGYFASQVRKWETSTSGCTLTLTNVPTCRYPTFRQSSTSTATWINTDLKFTKRVMERPKTAEMEEVLDIKRVIKSYDMKISEDNAYKLIGFEKHGEPNLAPGGLANNTGLAKTLTFHLIALAETETKLRVPHSDYPLASSLEEIVSWRESISSGKRPNNNSGTPRKKIPRLEATIKDTFALVRDPAPSTSTPNSSEAPEFSFDHNYATVDHQDNTADFNFNTQEDISESQLFLTASAVEELSEDERNLFIDEGEEEEKQEAA